MKILHLASFDGNHGDRFNHTGFYSWFRDLVPKNTNWNYVEIREFYRGKKTFDDEFLDLINQHDLFIIGGGNYFETWLANTWSGTSLDLHPSYIAKITCPIFINSIGLDINQGISDNARKNLPTLLNSLSTNPRVFLSLRDDGSLSNLKEIWEEETPLRVFVLPDSGYLALKGMGVTISKEQKKLVVNLASDMPGLRYGTPPDSSMDGFAARCASVLTKLLESESFSEVVFTIHLINDLEIVSKVISHVPDKLRRNQLRVTSYRMDDEGSLEILKEYASSNLILSTRFHGSVVSFGSALTVLGINTYPQIEKYYREWGNEARLISFASIEDCEEAYEKILQILTDQNRTNESNESLANSIDKASLRVRHEIDNWLTKNGVGMSKEFGQH